MTYITGLVFYACHFPECAWPGRFDYGGSSHQVSDCSPSIRSYSTGWVVMTESQIWHAAIVGAIVLHYRAIFVAHNARYEYSCATRDAGQPVAEVVEGLVRAVWGELRSGWR